MTGQPTQSHDDWCGCATGCHQPATPLPRQEPCRHPVRQRLSLVGNTINERCRICDVHLTTNRITKTSTVEVTGA